MPPDDVALKGPLAPPSPAPIMLFVIVLQLFENQQTPVSLLRPSVQPAAVFCNKTLVNPQEGFFYFPQEIAEIRAEERENIYNNYIHI